MNEDDRLASVRRGTRGPARLGTVNLRDVAARAGVSLATASRVFSDADNVSAPTRERVVAAADELGYVVNGLARAMTGRGPRTVAFVLQHMIGPTFASLAAGVEQVAAHQGHLMAISTTQGSPEREADLIGTLREQRAAAVLLVGSSDSSLEQEERIVAYADALADIGTALVLCGRPPVTGRPDLVSVDYGHAEGLRLAVDHLAALGHRRILYLGQPRGMTTPDARVDGFRSAARAHGLSADLIAMADNTERDGARAALEVLRGPSAPTAIVCMTDNIAVGVLRAARELGLAVPQDLSVIGFDDVPLVGDLTPALTTVHPPFFDLGVHAAQIALGLRPSVSAVLDVRLVERASTTTPRR